MAVKEGRKGARRRAWGRLGALACVSLLCPGMLWADTDIPAQTITESVSRAADDSPGNVDRAVSSDPVMMCTADLDDGLDDAVTAKTAPRRMPKDGRSYNAAADFSTTNGNPNGVWSYGYGDAFTPYVDSDIQHWWIAGAPLGVPSIWLNDSDSAIHGVAPGQVSIHPSVEPSILRFTAPRASIYTITGEFYAGNTGVMEPGIRQGDSWLWEAVDAGAFDLRTEMNAGETLDFVVRPNGTDFFSGDTPIEVTIAGAAPQTLSLGGVAEEAARPGQFADYVLELGDGDAANVLLRLTPGVSAGAGSGWQMVGRLGALPTLQANDWQSAGTMQDGAYELLVPNTGAGPYYFSVYYFNQDNSDPQPFTLDCQGIDRYVCLPHEVTGGNVGAITLPLSGVGFEEGVRVEVRDGEGSVITSAVPFVLEADSLAVSLDLNGVATGSYDIVVVWPDGHEQVLEQALEVTEGGAGKLETRLIVPPLVRPDREYMAYVEYANVGNADMAAPVLIVTSNERVPMTMPAEFGGEFARANKSADDLSGKTQGAAAKSIPGYKIDPVERVELLGLSPVSPVTVLPPGMRHRVPVFFSSATDAPNIEFTISVLKDEQEEIDWANYEQKCSACDSQAATQERLAPILAEVLGATWGEYYTTLLAAADYLHSVGRTVYDVSTLHNFELKKIYGFGTPSTLVRRTDAATPAAAMPVVFTRQFSHILPARMHEGPLGHGWTHSLDIWMETETSTAPWNGDAQRSVTIHHGNSGDSTFYSEDNGPYEGTATETGSLVDNGDGTHTPHGV